MTFVLRPSDTRTLNQTGPPSDRRTDRYDDVAGSQVSPTARTLRAISRAVYDVPEQMRDGFESTIPSVTTAACRQRMLRTTAGPANLERGTLE